MALHREKQTPGSCGSVSVFGGCIFSFDLPNVPKACPPAGGDVLSIAGPFMARTNPRQPIWGRPEGTP
jgi:hypothetical protein